MDLRIRNRQVATDKAASQKKNDGAAEDAVFIDTSGTVCYGRLEDASGRCRGIVAGWLPDLARTRDLRINSPSIQPSN
jgi:hypothetical protein